MMPNPGKPRMHSLIFLMKMRRPFPRRGLRGWLIGGGRVTEFYMGEGRMVRPTATR